MLYTLNLYNVMSIIPQKDDFFKKMIKFWVNDTILYTLNLLKVDLKCSHWKKRNMWGDDELTNPNGVITYTNIKPSCRTLWIYTLLSSCLNKYGEKNKLLMPFFFYKVYFLPIPFLHCPSVCYAVVVIQVQCSCLNNNAHSIYQFILKC